ncbi:MAG: hypothetical protein LC687_00740 [Actinobacteria bacterium]|nr:hypothetical protein [Actinomycetota bacterium]
MKENESLEILDMLPPGKIFDNAKSIAQHFPKASRPHNEILTDFENGEDTASLQSVEVDSIHITQPNIVYDKIVRFLDNVDQLAPIPVVQYEDEIAIADGHHRLVATWLSGKERIDAGCNLHILI